MDKSKVAGGLALVKAACLGLLAVSLMLMGAGCFGGGGGTAPAGSIMGHVFVPEEMTRGLGMRVEVTPTPPAGYAKCSGALVAVSGTSKTATTTADGYFRIDGVPTGRRTVSITYRTYTFQAQVDVIANQVATIGDPNTGAYMKPKKWTVMVYMCADNNLEAAGLEDVNEMESVGSTADVNVLVQLDRADGGVTDPTGDWTDTRRYYVKQDSDPISISSQMVADLGEVDMGNPSELQKFVAWAKHDYPADHYMLVLWNHGNGWWVYDEPARQRAVCFDDTTNTQLDVWEISRALSGLKVDVIGMDACLMQMAEVAYEVRNVADIMVGAQNETPGDGWNYQDILDKLVSTPAISSWDLSKYIADNFYDQYASDPDYYATQSAIKLGAMGDIANKVKALKDVLISCANDADQDLALATKNLIWHAWNYTDVFFYNDLDSNDLYDFASQICYYLNDCDDPGLQAEITALLNSGQARTAISDAALSLKDKLGDPSVLYSRAENCVEAPDPDDSWEYTVGAFGLSIYFPSKDMVDNLHYGSLAFERDTGWSQMFNYIAGPTPGLVVFSRNSHPKSQVR